MKPNKTKFIFSWAVFSILSLLSLKGFPAGQTTILQNTSSTGTGVQVTPNPEMFAPALQKCGKNYVEVKLSSYPLGSEGDVQTYWGCKLREGFYNSDELCPFLPKYGTTTKTIVDANYYKCSYADKYSQPTAQCLEGFSSRDEIPSSKDVPFTGQGTCPNGNCITTYSTYTYYSLQFKCVRDVAEFPIIDKKFDYDADPKACNPTDSWLGWTGSDPTIQVCGYMKSGVLAPSAVEPLPPSGPPTAPKPLPQ